MSKEVCEAIINSIQRTPFGATIKDICSNVKYSNKDIVQGLNVLKDAGIISKLGATQKSRHPNGRTKKIEKWILTKE